jgi:hypothetical protein
MPQPTQCDNLHHLGALSRGVEVAAEVVLSIQQQYPHHLRPRMTIELQRTSVDAHAYHVASQVWDPRECHRTLSDASLELLQKSVPSLTVAFGTCGRRMHVDLVHHRHTNLSLPLLLKMALRPTPLWSKVLKTVPLYSPRLQVEARVDLVRCIERLYRSRLVLQTA